jgi:hypothetical protein
MKKNYSYAFEQCDEWQLEACVAGISFFQCGQQDSFGIRVADRHGSGFA